MVQCIVIRNNYGKWLFIVAWRPLDVQNRLPALEAKACCKPQPANRHIARTARNKSGIANDCRCRQSNFGWAHLRDWI